MGISEVVMLAMVEHILVLADGFVLVFCTSHTGIVEFLYQTL